ncbi:subtilisin-like serine protease [Medicago truncatula]|uniref:Subtilisin-like serine protease n=2 Tax=Medicago truncatula TaxID=3880 RepID=A0A072TP02_MEDTR|nr:subtilisin-like serine protease [Medicago truncatula]
MDLSAMPKVFSNKNSWYESTLSQVTTNNLNNPTFSKIIYTYNNVINGFSANLSPEEHEALKTSPGYISSMPDLPLKLDTTHSPQFLGLNSYKGAWPASDYGKDVIVGMIDTGVWPESESFKDNDMPQIPSKWKGQLCQFENTNNSSFCNKKLIGARFFNKGFLAKYPNLTNTILNSTRDTNGHGTHTSTTAAGNQVDGASFFGYANGTARGIATLSRVAMYKTAWGKDGHAVSSDIIAAVDASISDGVDVLSISLGLNNVSLYEDPVAIATFSAMERGVVVSTSAGNDGPSFKTLHNGIPWVITVAASTLDREFRGNLTLGNGVSLSGLSFYLGNFSASNIPIVFMGKCDNITQLIKVKSKIVVCEDKNGTLFDQVSNLLTVIVVGAVIISNTSQNNLSQLLGFQLPYIIINQTNGEIIKDYIQSNSNSSSIEKISFKITSFGAKPAPSVDFYSSRGPSESCPNVLKPDITGPGTSILAAWPTNIPVLEFGSRKVFNKFNFLSGTSMSSPHVAGVGALLKAAHVDWSPAAIRSAMMTTSDIFDNTKELIKDIGKGNNVATPFAQGAGHINPNKALNPGLVYDVGVQDYVNLLCALNFTQKNITIITRSSTNDCSKPSLDLNYPSFIAFFNAANSSSRTTQEFHRTITNVGQGKSIYVAHITRIEGFHVRVIPNKLVFNKKNEKLSYKLRIEDARVAQKNEVSFGYLTWQDGKHVVRSPIVVTTPNFNL